MEKEQKFCDREIAYAGLHFLLVDDHEMTATLTAEMLRNSFAGCEATTVTTVEQALQRLRSGKVFATTIVLLDLVLATGSGMDFLDQVKDVPVAGDLATLVLSGKTAQQDIDACRAAGARGYVLKRASLDVVNRAICELLAGREFFCEGDAPVEQEAPSQLTRLAPAVRRVFPLLRQGLKNKEIGERLSLTEQTVKQHVNKIYKVLEVKTKAELIARYGNNG